MKTLHLGSTMYLPAQSTRYSSSPCISTSFPFCPVCAKPGLTAVTMCSCGEWTGMIHTALLIFAKQWPCVPECQQQSVGFLDHKRGNIYGNIHMWNGQKTWNIKQEAFCCDSRWNSLHFSQSCSSLRFSMHTIHCHGYWCNRLHQIT